MTRAEHMAWAKQRALEYAERGDRQGCVASMLSDLGKHPETAPSQQIGAVLAMCLTERAEDLRRWVEGFN